MDKSPDAFRTISEVAELLDTPAHVLRFWESRFPQIKPVKRAGGRRYYRPADVELLTGIRRLLHEDGLTIRGVQKVLREQGVRHVSGLSEDDAFDDDGLEFEPDPKPRSVEPIPLFPEARPAVSAAPKPVNDDTVEDAVVMAPTPEPHPPTLYAGDLAADEDVSPAANPVPREAPKEEEMRKSQPTPNPDQDEAAPELPLEFPAAKQPGVPLVDKAPAAFDAMDEGNIFADAEGDAAKDVLEDVAPVEAQKPMAEPEVKAGPPAVDKTESTPMTDAEPAPKPVLPVLDTSEIHAEWPPADLRALPQGAFGDKRPQAEALLQRLQALRNRVGDLGRVPRR